MRSILTSAVVVLVLLAAALGAQPARAGVYQYEFYNGGSSYSVTLTEPDDLYITIIYFCGGSNDADLNGSPSTLQVFVNYPAGVVIDYVTTIWANNGTITH